MKTSFASKMVDSIALVKKGLYFYFIVPEKRSAIPGLFSRPGFFAVILLLVTAAFCNKAVAQFSNITINSAGPTSGGTWNGAAPWIFTPNAATATILNTDIQTRLATGNVTIAGNTNVGGVNPGSITISNTITVSNTSATANTLTFTAAAAGSLSVNAAINIAGANGTGTSGAAGGAGHNLTLTGGTNSLATVVVAAPLSTYGGAGAVHTGGVGGAGRKGGNILVSCGGTVTVNTGSAFDASGGAGGNGNSNGGAAGAGGTIAAGITGTPVGGTVSISSAFTASGGAGGNAGNGNNSGGAGGAAANISVVSSVAVSTAALIANGGSSGNARGTNGLVGGQGGVVTVNSGAGTTVTIGGKISSVGGNGSVVLASNANGGNGGPGNTITITGPGGITIGNSDSLITYGGNGGGGMNSTSGNGGAGGAVQLISAGAVSIGTSSGINTAGGKGADGATSTKGGNGGTGGTITIGNATPIGGAINIGSSLISSGGIAGNAVNTNNAGGAGGVAGNISIVSSSSVNTGIVTANGGHSGTSYGSTGSAGANAGTITITGGSGAIVTVAGKISANGGNGSNAAAGNANGTTGGSGNSIIITGPGGITIGASDSLTSYGGAGGAGNGATSGAGGAGGNITLASAAGNVSIASASGINASGGAGGSTVTPQTAGAGGAGGIVTIGNATPIGGAVNISSTIISSGGAGGNAPGNNSSGGGGGTGGAVNVVASGSVNTLAITSNGGNSGNCYGSAGVTGGNAGAVKITSGTGTIVTIGGKIAANGGNGGNVLSGNGAGAAGGTANTITITGPGGISIGNSDSLTARGGYGGTGNGGNGGNGSAGNIITLNSSAGAVVIGTSSGITTVGGNGGSSTGTRGNGGNAAAINITGFAGVTMPSNLSATGGILGVSGTGGAVGTAANVTINDGNSTVTSGGANDGISGIVSGLKFIKSGSGTLNIAGVNTYTDSTSLYGGSLQLAAAGVIPDASNTGFYGGGLSTGAATGYNETAATIKLTDNSVINVGAGGHSLNFSASNAVAWTAGKILTITNWNGPYDGTTAGAANGKVYVGSNASGLTTAQLAQIKFLRPSNGLLYDALILSTGEIVAYDPALVYINVLNIIYPSCTGNSGSITVGGFGGVAPYTYNINNGAYQVSGTFSGLGAGIYTLGVKDNNGQTKTTVVELDVLVVTSDTGTCAGGSVQLQANTAGAYSYSWSPGTGLSSTTIANPVASPASSTVYTATAVVIDNTVNLIANPGFESGNTGFGSSYIYHICGPYASSWSPAPAPPCDTYGQFHNGIYKVRKNATDLCTNLTNFNARTGDSMLVVDGPNSGSFVTAPFWSQTLTGLAINTNYLFTFWVRQAFNGAGAFAVVRTDINSTPVTGTATYPNPYTASSSAWTQMSYFWNSGASTSATISMYDQTVADAANDFAIDDMSFYITCNASKNVTVNITVTPTLNTVTPPAQVCAGSGASISLTGLTAVDTFTVNYTINGVAQTPIAGIISDGSGNASFTSAVLSALNNGQVLQVTSLTNTGGHSNCTQTFTGKTVTLVVNTSGTWLGTTNTDWNTATNWCGGVPTATTDVLVPDYGPGGTYPVINAAVAGTCRNIVLSANASVTINNNGSLAVSGTYSSTGALTNNGELIFNSSNVAQSFPGATGTVSLMNNLTINNTSGLGVTFNRDFSIYGALTPTAGIVDVNNALITLTSTATTNARVGIVGGGFTYTGTGQFAVERYYPAQRSWRLVTAPLYATNDIFVDWQLNGAAYSAGNMARGLLVTGPGATSPIGANGLDISQQQNPSLRIGASLTPVVNTHVPLSKNAGTSADNLGYFLFVRGDRDPNNTVIPFVNVTTVTSKGKLQTGPQVFAGNPLANKLELIGNPYASPVSFKTLGRSNLKNRFYAWDPSLNDQGAYVIVDDILNTGSYTKSPTSPGGQDSLIQSCQAIYVETIADGASVLTFNETDKATQNNTGMFRPALPVAHNNIASLRTNLYIINPANAPVLADGNLVQFNENFADAVDGDDATKPVNVHETFGLLRYGKVLGIERRPLINNRDTLFFNFKSFQQRTYRFEFIPFNINNTIAYLEDKYLNRTTRLNINRASSFDFTINGDPLSSAAGRFKIIFRKAADLISINAAVSLNKVQVKWQKDGEEVFDQYTIERSADGTSFEKVAVLPAKHSRSKTTYSWTDNEVVPGEYYYRVTGDVINTAVQAEEKYYSNEAGVVLDKINRSGMYVFPNPVSGKTIQLQMNSMPAGRYSVALVDNNGREVVTGNINHAAGSNVEKISLKDGLPAGNYHLKISGPGKYQSALKILYK